MARVAESAECDAISRLRRRGSRRADDGLRALEREIAGEIAASLGRAEQRIVAALARLGELSAAVDEARARRDRGALERAARRFNEVRGLAEHRLWELTVQREALGFRRHDALASLYPLPPRADDTLT